MDKQIQVREPLVYVAGRIPFTHWERLVEIAINGDMIRGNHYNVSDALRAVVARGLDVENVSVGGTDG